MDAGSSIYSVNHIMKHNIKILNENTQDSFKSYAQILIKVVSLKTSYHLSAGKLLCKNKTILYIRHNSDSDSDIKFNEVNMKFKDL